jgi:ketosteroid isomerase-like protein
MAEQERNIEIARKSYAAFSSGDTDTLMGLIDAGIEWTVPGQSTISRTYRGRSEYSTFLRMLSEKTATVRPTRFFADGDTVVVLTEGMIDGQPTSDAQVLTLRDGRVVRGQTHPDTALLERVWGQR